MGACAETKGDGTPCRGIAGAGGDRCPAHDPARAAARRRAASRAGRARPNNELAQIKTDLQGMVDALLAGELDRGTAAVCGQLMNVRLRAVEIQRRTSDLGELMARLEALEDRASRLRGA